MLNVKYVHRYGRSLLASVCINSVGISAHFQKGHASHRVVPKEIRGQCDDNIV